MHSTNYDDTFIEVAPDCPAEIGTVPPERQSPSVAALTFSLLAGRPYEWTSDDLLFRVHVLRKNIAEADQEKAREAFFSKGQACLRASPLTKTYGWGAHFDNDGRVALVARESCEYSELSAKASTVKPAMRNKRR